MTELLHNDPLQLHIIMIYSSQAARTVQSSGQTRYNATPLLHELNSLDPPQDGDDIDMW